MAQKNIKNVVIENAQLIFRNFAGKEAKFNDAGKRNFCVFIDDDEKALAMIEEGWNVRMLKPGEEGGESRYYISVAVSYKHYPPKIMLITGHNQTLLDEDSVATLDYADISNVDLIIRPYCWEAQGDSGIKAYLKSMYVTIEEDVFAKKYSANEFDSDEEELPF